MAGGHLDRAESTVNTKESGTGINPIYLSIYLYLSIYHQSYIHLLKFLKTWWEHLNPAMLQGIHSLGYRARSVYEEISRSCGNSLCLITF